MSIFSTIKYQLVKNYLEQKPQVLELFYYPERQIKYLVKQDVFKIDYVERIKDKGQMMYQIHYKNFNQIADFVEDAIVKEDKRTYVVNEGIKTRKEIDRINNQYRQDNESPNYEAKNVYDRIEILDNTGLEAMICTKFGYGSFAEILEAGIKLEDLMKELGDIDQVEVQAENLKAPDYYEVADENSEIEILKV